MLTMAQKIEIVQKNIAAIEAWTIKKEALITEKLELVQKAGYAVGETSESLFASNGREIRFIDKELQRAQVDGVKPNIESALGTLASSSVPGDYQSKQRQLSRLKVTEAELLAALENMTPEQLADKQKREDERAMIAYIKAELHTINIPSLDKWLAEYKEAYIASANKYMKGWELSNALRNVDQAVTDQKIKIIVRSFEKVGKLTDINFGRIGMDGSFNGTVTGEKGSANIRTILAGGYNIQCLHYRVLVN